MFSERQWLGRNPIIWVIGALVSLSLAVAGGATLATGGRRELLATAALAGAFALLMSANLNSRIQERQLILAYWPIWKRTLDLDKVQRAYAQEYDWWRFGGWGIRVGSGAVAYSVWGKQAVRLEMPGWDLVVTTQNPEGLLRALAQEGVRVDEDPVRRP